MLEFCALTWLHFKPPQQSFCGFKVFNCSRIFHLSHFQSQTALFRLQIILCSGNNFRNCHKFHVQVHYYNHANEKKDKTETEHLRSPLNREDFCLLLSKKVEIPFQKVRMATCAAINTNSTTNRLRRKYIIDVLFLQERNGFFPSLSHHQRGIEQYPDASTKFMTVNPKDTQQN